MSPPGLKALEVRIFLKGFRFSGKSKQALMVETRLLHHKEKPTDQLLLFVVERRKFTIPELDATAVYLLYGKIVVEFGYPSMEVAKMARLPNMRNCWVLSLF